MGKTGCFTSLAAFTDSRAPHSWICRYNEICRSVMSIMFSLKRTIENVIFVIQTMTLIKSILNYISSSKGISRLRQLGIHYIS